ncbi:MAG: hypothetical protein ACRC1D_08215 [Culicoidibacterales bacterium]
MWERILVNLSNLITLSGIGFLGGFTRVIVEPKRRSFLQIMSYLLVSSVVCFGVGLYFVESDWSMAVSFAGMFSAGFFCHSLLNHVVKNEQGYIDAIEKKIKRKIDE